MLSRILLALCLLLGGTTLAAADALLPDPLLTPGNDPINPQPTMEQLCTPGYTKTVRDVKPAVAKEVFRLYGIDYALHSNYEVDHLCSLVFACSNSIKNLWPQAYAPNGNKELGARKKDVLEVKLYKLVCAGKVPLEQARKDISEDWIAAFDKYVGGDEHIKAELERRKQKK